MNTAAVIGTTLSLLAASGAAAEDGIMARIEEAENALARNEFEEGASNLATIGKEKGCPAALRARALRDEAIARLARDESHEAIEALCQAVAADPDYPGNPALLRLIYLTIHESGRPDSWERQLDRLERVTSDHPDLHARLLALRWLDAKHRNRIEEANRHREELHRIDDFLVIGPFDNSGGGRIEDPFPPEEEIDRDATYRDPRGRPIQWLDTESQPFRVVDLDVVLDDPLNAVAYGVTHVRAPETTPAVIHLHGSGAFRLWVNGVLVLDEPKVRESALELYEVPVTLEGGWNRVLVKIGAETERLRFFLRITDPEGRALDLETRADPGGWSSPIDPSPETVTADIPRGTARFPAGGWLRRWQAALEDASLADRLLHVRHLITMSFYEEADDAIREILRLFPDSALPEEQRFFVLLDQESGEATTSLRKAADTAPELFSARLLLIAQLMEQNETEEAWESVNDALETFADNPYLVTLHGLLLMEKGKIVEGLAELEEAVRAAPGNMSIWGLYRGALEAIGDSRKYDEALRAAREARPDIPDLSRLLAALALQRRDYDTALEELQVAFEVGASPAIIHREMAKVLEEAGRTEEAVEALERGLRFSPMSRAITQELGGLLLKLGREEEALACFERHLELEPASFDVRHMMRELRGLPPLREHFPHEDVATLLPDSADALDPEANAVRLLDTVDIIQYPDGAFEEFHHTVTKVLTESGVQAHRSMSTSGGLLADSEVEIARVLKPDGREIEADVFFNTVSFKELEPGDIVEIRSVERRAPRPGLSGHFWHSHMFQARTPSLVSRFSLLAPEGLDFQTRTHRFELEPEVTRTGDWVLRTWELRDLPADRAEPSMPPAIERVAWLDISSLSSWDDVVRWYQGISQGRTRTTEAIRELARELSVGADTEEARIRGVANYVRERIKYGGGVFSESAYVPHSADQVLRQRYGDCKDQTALIVALLEEMGIRARFALVNSLDVASVPFLPSPRFTHAIAQAVTSQGKVFWIDPTAENLHFPNIPAELEGAMALLIDPQEAVFVPIAEDSPAENGSRAVLTASVTKDGALEIAGSVRYVGEDGAQWRRIVTQAPERKTEFVERVVGQQLPGAEVSDVVFHGADAIDQPLRLEYRMASSRAVTYAGELLIVSIPWTFTTTPHDLVSMESRQHALVLDSWRGVYEEEIRLTLPEGYRAMSDLGRVDLRCDLGTFHLEAHWVDGNVLVLERRLEILAARVEPEDYAQFRFFLSEAWKAEQQQILLQPVDSPLAATTD